MTEKIVKESLGFLFQKHGMLYDYREKQNYMGYCDLRCFTYYNNDGCFTITDLTQSDDVDFVRLGDIRLLDSYISSSYSQKQKNIVRIFEYEPEIWARHKKKGFLKIPFFWGSNKQVLRALSEVIDHQIQSTGQFFGIKVTKQN